MAPTKNMDKGKMPMVLEVDHPFRLPLVDPITNKAIVRDHSKESPSDPMAMEVLDAVPIVVLPPPRSSPAPWDVSVDLSLGRPTHTMTPGRTRGVPRALSPRRGPNKPRSTTPRRPIAGQLAPRMVPAISPRLPISSEGTSSLSVSYTPSTPPDRRVVATGLGRGKVLQPPLTSEERNAAPSFNSINTPKTVRRTSNPPSINGPPGQFEDEDQKSDFDRLLGVVASLRKKNRELEEKVAELHMNRWELEDKFRTLRIGMGTKLKRLANTVGHEEALEPPSP
jgi:hypothetical protein